MVKKVNLLFALTLLFIFSAIHVFAEIPESTVSLAQKYGISSEELHSKLKSSETDRELELIPMTKEHLDFYVNLYSNPENKEYMKYYGTGLRKSSKIAEDEFEKRLSRMWDEKLPTSLAFVLKYNDNLAGFISVGSLTLGSATSSNPAISRVIDKNYAGKGLGTFCAKTVVSVLQKLKDLGFYEYTSLVSTSDPNNIASRSSAIKAGFKQTSQEPVKTCFGLRNVFEYEFS